MDMTESIVYEFFDLLKIFSNLDPNFFSLRRMYSSDK